MTFFQSVSVLPENPLRRGEGGLRLRASYNSCERSGNGVGNAGEAPLITVITVVFNGVQTIEKTILSVINQSYENIEYIIIDAGSNDGTPGIIRKYEHAIDYWVSEPDAGIYDAWNKGVCLSTGNWISFLGADDVYLDGALAAYVDVILKHRNTSLQYLSSKINLVADANVVRTVGQAWDWRVFRKYMNVAHVGSLQHRSLFEQYGLYDVSYKICGDYELLLRVGSSLRSEYLAQITANMNIGGVSGSSVGALTEAARAKISSGGRSRFLTYVEKVAAICKWKLRTWLWY